MGVRRVASAIFRKFPGLEVRKNPRCCCGLKVGDRSDSKLMKAIVAWHRSREAGKAACDDVESGISSRGVFALLNAWTKLRTTGPAPSLSS